MDTITDMLTLKEKFVKKFNNWGQTLRKWQVYWQNMKFDHNKHDVEQVAYDLKVLVQRVIHN